MVPLILYELTLVRAPKGAVRRMQTGLCFPSGGKYQVAPN
jgi:hypothetical protein